MSRRRASGSSLLVSLKPDHSLDKVVHLCKMDSWGAVSAAPLRVPGNASAPAASLLLAPEWLFSHFPYGIFFPAYRVCHAASWGWEGLSPLEQRLCMPGFRVPTVMVHMAGLRNGQWGRRGVMRAFGVWHEEADKVAPETWVSPRTERLVAAGPDMLRAGLASMSDFDAFAARLLLLGLLLGRRVVMPPLPKDARWAERAIEPRHLRAIEVGCGPDKQRVWLPMPHFKEPWCSGVDFLYEIDYRAVAPSIPPADVSHIAAASLRVAPESAAGALITMSDGARRHTPSPPRPPELPAASLHSTPAVNRRPHPPRACSSSTRRAAAAAAARRSAGSRSTTGSGTSGRVRLHAACGRRSRRRGSRTSGSCATACTPSRRAGTRLARRARAGATRQDHRSAARRGEFGTCLTCVCRGLLLAFYAVLT
ncbi:hypothetical protein EMIHUDRAFT_439439, partial [Emiliania huxleyi CCMP1516]|uniref:Uncharacterized protein n=2 Tax=Emiliania huxleyi TaxID=2903 RepID=A0A0D3KZ23_EMIH1